VPASTLNVLDLPPGVAPDPGELVRAAMKWHFDPETGSPFWLERAKTLGFDPRYDVREPDDLALFPNVTDELREVPVGRLIPIGYGPRPEIVSIIESGGTTGAPKRLPLLRDYSDRMVAAEIEGVSRAGVPKTKNWLTVMPSGPHGALDQSRRAGHAYGVLVFAVDMDPRWVKKQIAAGNQDAAQAYAEHIIDQAEFVLRGQDVGTIRLTPPLLARIVRRDDLIDLIREKISYINWGGTHMDADSRFFYRTELFPEARLSGGYGTTMALGAVCNEREKLAHDSPCIYDPSLSPYVTMRVADPSTGQTVAYGERGQLVVSHVSKSFLLANNFERDTAVRVKPVYDQVGDSVANIEPLAQFAGTEVVEGVY
jgi:hypothetical protein